MASESPSEAHLPTTVHECAAAAAAASHSHIHSTLSLSSPPQIPQKNPATARTPRLLPPPAPGEKMMLPRLLLLLVVSPLPLASVAAGAVGVGEGFCSAEPSAASGGCSGVRPPLYWKATNPTLAPAHLQDLPGFTRSVYRRDHALITPESHVFSPLPDWVNTLGAYLISPAIGAHFTMYLAKMHDGSKSALPPKGVERLIFVLQGSILLSEESGNTHTLLVDSYAYLPANMKHSVISDEVTTLVIFERRYTTIEGYHPDLIVGSTDKQPLLETPGEVFELRKLLPTSLPYDFNIHIMDFQPGEYLNVKEVHYNQHGLLLLEGQGIYRLGDSWYPVQSGDTIWMTPYAALGKTKTRYLLYKDVNRDPLI
uniref:Cupin 2 conserved barrel domain-containing protein n=1 Tax=Oryza meridionalis TaxID=40149 RepID=A0A0E0EBF4_9ORYZ